MATTLTAPNRLTSAQKRGTTTLCLAGPFDGDVIRIAWIQLERTIATKGAR